MWWGLDLHHSFSVETNDCRIVSPEYKTIISFLIGQENSVALTFVSWLRCADIVFQAQVHWCWVLVHIALTSSMVHDLLEQPAEETRPSQMPMTSPEHPAEEPFFFYTLHLCPKCKMWLNGDVAWEEHQRNSKKHHKKTESWYGLVRQESTKMLRKSESTMTDKVCRQNHQPKIIVIDVWWRCCNNMKSVFVCYDTSFDFWFCLLCMTPAMFRNICQATMTTFLCCDDDNCT